MRTMRQRCWSVIFCTIFRTISIVMVGGLLAVGAQAADIKIGYVDIQKAIESTAAGKKAKKQLEGEFKKKQKDLVALEKDIKKMRDDFEKKKDVLSEQVKRDKQIALQNEMIKYREIMARSQMEIQKKQRELTDPILKKIRTAITGIATKGKYTVIFEKAEQSVLWAKKDIDLTDKVVKVVEKMKK